ncbi:hypothetical protein B0H34DRAFT_794900 [Crassisporium funariophilum]|nr:hypothetical protein B0H34DRAFT_794900 [Crassisporium funariophilum]
MSNERPAVVAPRPVRLSSATFNFTRRQETDDLKVSFYADIGDKHSPDPRASPRSALQTEALEEFLSILRPTFMRKPRPISFPAFLHEPALSHRPRQQQRLENASDPGACDVDPRADPSHQTGFDSESVIKDMQVDPDARWFSSSLLSSPISRMHTRNPFQKNSDNRSPILLSPNPATVPLPLPTPDEFVDNI